jgi:hypothetical protein
VPDLAGIPQRTRERFVQRNVDRAVFRERELRRAGTDAEHAEPCRRASKSAEI